MVEIRTIQALVQQLPVFVTGPPDCSIEDSYVHSCIAPILKPIFACESFLRIEWANCHLNKKDSKGKKTVKVKGQLKVKDNKPDFAANVKAPNSWISVVVCEFKRPGFSPCFESDLVKIGKEMRTMLNYLIRLGVPSPSVGGILIQGRQITTFQFDIVAPKLYRMVKLCELVMFDTLD
ncbi:hypothetical protein DFQ28_001064 [Apophysomyces sp. BC1034]|nr:hypothetical protein DFQ30_001079 [Apophysomyces sp. BC1015]KAG0180638.1 hypothetical protein DFQ29_000248 [Apophysomyces sp. BC1021]KAG0191034.1 hypothetical protein DFQ28_001064 [Apophysomyces sp. BC1034]